MDHNALPFNHSHNVFMSDKIRTYWGHYASLHCPFWFLWWSSIRDNFHEKYSLCSHSLAIYKPFAVRQASCFCSTSECLGRNADYHEFIPISRAGLKPILPIASNRAPRFPGPRRFFFLKFFFKPFFLVVVVVVE